MIRFEMTFHPEDLEYYRSQIGMVSAYCKEKGRKVHLLIEPEVKHRSNPQRNHINGHIQQICQETGNDFDDVKKYIKQKAIAMGYPRLKKAGHDVVDMWGNPVGISEADASTTECALLIECAHMLASELGIMLKETPFEI